MGSVLSVLFVNPFSSGGVLRGRQLQFVLFKGQGFVDWNQSNQSSGRGKTTREHTIDGLFKDLADSMKNET